MQDWVFQLHKFLHIELCHPSVCVLVHVIHFGTCWKMSPMLYWSTTRHLFQTHKSQPKSQSSSLHRYDKVRDGSSDPTPPYKMLRRSDDSPVSRHADSMGHKAKTSQALRGKNGKTDWWCRTHMQLKNWPQRPVKRQRQCRGPTSQQPCALVWIIFIL